jgi:hypothetical protein
MQFLATIDTGSSAIYYDLVMPPQDIVSASRSKDYVICGFFTQDYRPLAEQLASTIKSPEPFHFFFREKRDASWRDIVRWKPDIIAHAMHLYPNCSIILLDVDCIVRGELRPMTDFAGDISAYPTLRFTRHPWPLRRRTILHISSRTMVFKPTARTKAFLEAWRQECKDPEGLYRKSGCELALRVALMRATGLAFCPMDARYSGREVDKAPADAVIVHSSASRGKR